MPVSQKLTFTPNDDIEDPDGPNDWDHYLHLSDGRTLKIKHSGVHSNVYVDRDGTRYLVIGVYPKDV